MNRFAAWMLTKALLRNTAPHKTRNPLPDRPRKAIIRVQQLEDRAAADSAVGGAAIAGALLPDDPAADLAMLSSSTTATPKPAMKVRDEPTATLASESGFEVHTDRAASDRAATPNIAATNVVAGDDQDPFPVADFSLASFDPLPPSVADLSGPAAGGATKNVLPDTPTDRSSPFAAVSPTIEEDRSLASRPGEGSVATADDPFDDVEIPNTAPVAVNDTATVAEDGTVLISVLQNDTDADGDPLTLIEWDVQTDHGTAVINSAGVLKYTPEADYHGSDTIEYTMSDGMATASGTVTVTVTPVNDDVKAFNDAYPVYIPGVAPPGWDFAANAAAGLFHNDIDWDGTAVALGTVNTTGLAGTLQVDPDGAFRYQRPPNFWGRTSFTYTVTADGQESAPATVILDVGQHDNGPMPDPPPPEPYPEAHPDHYFYGDDPLVVPAAEGVLANDIGLDIVVLESHPASGRVTAFGFDGSFTYLPTKRGEPPAVVAPMKVMGNYLQEGTTRIVVSAGVEATLEPINVRIHNGQGGPAVQFTLEEDIGAFSVANLNDTDNDAIQDKDDGLVFPVIGVPGWAEIDLMKVHIRPVTGPAPAGQKLKLTVNGPAKLWATQFKGQEVVLNNGVVEYNPGDIPAEGKDLWLEATNVSGSLRDISVKLEFGAAKDVVTATGLWATSSVINAGNAIPANLDEKVMRQVLQRRFNLGATWGPTTWTEPLYNGGVYDYDMWRNAILIQFTLRPAGVGLAALNAKVRIDPTRTIEARVGKKEGNQAPVLSPPINFPAWLEQSNDDRPGTGNEDRVPKNDEGFVADFPGTEHAVPTFPQEAPPIPMQYFKHRMNAFEFIRVLFNGNEFPATETAVIGSRASGYQPWYSRIDLIRKQNDTAHYQRAATPGENEINVGYEPLGQLWP